MELVLLNPRLSDLQARREGLVTGVLPVDRFDDEDVMRVAPQVAAGPMRALGIAKQLLNQAAGIDRLDYHLDQELDQLARIADGEEFAEGLESFFAKRPPLFNRKAG